MLIETAAKLLLTDIKSITTSKMQYPASSDISSVDENLTYLPDTLHLFLKTIITTKDRDRIIASIGQAVMQAARPRVLIAPLQIGLGVQLHHHFASKFLIDTLNSMGFCSSYSEVHTFESSAAASQGTNLLSNLSDGYFGQFVADNVDHNTCTIDGNNTFHGMGIIVGISPEVLRKIVIPRISVSREEMASLGRIDIHFFRPEIDRFSSLVFEALCDFNVEDSTSKLDLLWKLSWPVKPTRPGWSGTMQMIHTGIYPGKSTIYFLPMIDMNPSDVSCVYSTLIYVCEQAKHQGCKPVVTFDQPLYWKALSIIYGERSNSDLNSVILRLGGFHLQMSFLGSIGFIMNGTGLREVLENVYATNAIDHMLSGKAVSRAVRGHFLVDTALNALLVSRTFNVSLPSLTAEAVDNPETTDTDSTFDRTDNNYPTITENVSNNSLANESISTDENYLTVIEHFDNLLFGYASVESVCADALLEKVDKMLLDYKVSLSKFRTASMWIQYMDMIDILRTFVKAERTGNWELHLKSIQSMLPYFAASGHNLYLKSAYLYLQHMQSLPNEHPEVFELFKSGNHVLRRTDRFWAGLSTDLVIEQVLMRSVKATGGLTRGRGLSEEQRSQWLLAMPACADYNVSMQHFTDVEYMSSQQHKEATAARKERDAKDTMLVLKYLQERDVFVDDESLRSIETGITSDGNVNADKAKGVGLKILNSMTGNKVVDFSFKKSDQVVTLNSKLSIKVDSDTIQVDPQLLFQRLIAAANRLVEDIPSVFEYELCAFPSSIFDCNGLLREAQKPSLAAAIWNLGDCSPVEAVDGCNPNYVIDGGSLLQRIPWKKGTTFNDICQSYCQYVDRRFPNATVVFDGYKNGPSTKDLTHLRRTKGIKSTTAKFSSISTFSSKKETFLANCENKQSFINMLGACLEETGHLVYHADGDADVLIAKTAVNCSKNCNTLLIGEDTDLLVLLCHYVCQDSHDLYFTSHLNQVPGRVAKIWDIKRTANVLGQDICHYLPFIHAITGCDTTSRMFGIGKGMALKKARSDNYFKQQAEVFLDVQSSVEKVITAGEEAISCLYGGMPLEGLNILRFRKFTNKVTSNTTCVQVNTLPPTAAAARNHSLRIFLQVQEWIGQGDHLDPCLFGWHISNGKLFPVKTSLPPAPDCLLKVIKCNCKTNCDSKRCMCRKHGLDCSIDCGNCRGTGCSNSPGAVESEDTEEN